MIVAGTQPLALRRSPAIEFFESKMRSLIQSGGPTPREYGVVHRLIADLADAARHGCVTDAEIFATVSGLTLTHLNGTLQADALFKKYGYSGDFEIIDHIYTLRTNPAPLLRRWDLFFHAQAAPCAVRNRKTYFHQLLQAHAARRTTRVPLTVLNVASGPGRDLREWFQSHSRLPVQIDCVEMDVRAIEYAQKLCAPWLRHIGFHHLNVLRSVPDRGYDLVWSAGLFDYLSDRVFVHLLKSLLAVTKARGEVVIGNFSDCNPSRAYMEVLGDWHLHHRSHETLVALAGQAGASPDRVQVFWEPQGVNQFLHVRRSS